MGWIDRIGNIASLGEHTAYEVALFLNWYEYLNSVARRSGIDISDARWQYQDALHYVGVHDFDRAYQFATEAVKLARQTLKANGERLKSLTWNKRNEITQLLSQAQSENIDVSAFMVPLTTLDRMYTSGDYIAAFDYAHSLYDDIRQYMGAVRAGRPYSVLSGAYDIPEGTTDILVVNVNVFEGSGWLQETYREEFFKRQIEQIIKEQAPHAEVLGYKVIPPRIIVYIRSPLPFLAALAIGLAIVAAFLLVVMWGLNTFLGVGRENKIAERTLELEDQRQQFIQKVYDDVREGRISEETAQAIIDAYNEGYEQTMHTVQQSSQGLVGQLTTLAIAVAGGIVAVKAVGYLLERRRGGAGGKGK